MYKVIRVYFPNISNNGSYKAKDIYYFDALEDACNYVYRNSSTYYYHQPCSEEHLNNNQLKDIRLSILSGEMTIVDSLDIPVHVDVIMYHCEETIRRWGKKTKNRRFHWNGDYTFRYDPVPGLPRSRRLRRIYRKRKMRNAKAMKSLIHDDYGYHRRHERNWKNYRKTQWKG